MSLRRPIHPVDLATVPKETPPMVRRTRPGRRFACFFSLFLLASLATAATAPASPIWRLVPFSNSTVPSDAAISVQTTSPGSASPAADEVQAVTVTAGAGQFRLSFGGEITADIAAAASPGMVQTELEALSTIGSGNVSVTGGPGNNYGSSPYLVTFGGALGSQDVEEIVAEDGSAPLAPAMTYFVQLRNLSTDKDDGSPVQISGQLPAGFSGIEVSNVIPNSFTCSDLAGQTSFSCLATRPFQHARAWSIRVSAAVEPGAGGVETAHYSASGGGGAPVTSADPVTISASPAGFGLDAFDMVSLGEEGGDHTQAAGHPSASTANLDFNIIDPPAGTLHEKSEDDRGIWGIWPAEPVKDLLVDLPPGFVANLAAVPQCSVADLSNDPSNVQSKPLCSTESQIGTVYIRVNGIQFGDLAPIPVYNLVPPYDAPAQLGFAVLGSVNMLRVSIRSSGDYGVSVAARNISEGLPVIGSTFTVWNDPADTSHDFERACAGEKGPFFPGPTCKSTAAHAPHLRQPTACTEPGGGLAATASADSWFHPGDFVEKSFVSHQLPGYPLPEADWGAPQGTTGCAKVKFNPQIEAQPTTDTADAPSGLDFHLSIPQDCWEVVEEICQSDLEDAEVTLPRGMTLNPSAASGLGACTPEQIGLATPVGASPIHFDTEPPSCPDSSKIGTVEIASPLLGIHDADGNPVLDSAGTPVPDPLEGSVYLAKQVDNPFGSLLAFYLVAEGSGVIVKQAGEIRIGDNGRLTTIVSDAPQLPFSDLHLRLDGGPRAPLRTPPNCGTFAVQAKLTPWSGTGTVTRGAGFEISSCPNSGFDPKLSAGTENPLAGATSPFSLRLTREDGTQELGGLQVALPPGLTGYLRGIPYCSDAALDAISGELGTGASQEASPSCPAASRVGTVTVGAGAGSSPFYTSSGRAYLAGPYKGAPASLAVIAPAVAGPFDLGSVLVRNAIHVDPTSAQLTIDSDPLPSVLHGVPLDLRDVRVEIDRDHFTLNPTSCDEMQIRAAVTSVQGATANRAQRFQLAGCDRLGFKPRLSMRLGGKTRRGGNPALTAVMRPRVGNANASRIQVTLPGSEFLAQSHIRTVCTRVQFAVDQCPRGSIYGQVTAFTPILDYPLYGNVYLRSSDNPLPDLVLALRGPASQPIEIDAVGRIDSKNGGMRTTFEGLPDAPLTKVVLSLPGGRKSLLENNTNICRRDHRATVKMDAHNGKIRDFRPLVRADCGRRSGGRGSGSRR